MALTGGLMTGCWNAAEEVSPVAAGTPANATATALGGTAAVGSPIVGGTLNVQCVAGTPQVVSTSANGTWSVDTTGQTYPCAVQVKGGTVAGVVNAALYHSIAINPGVANVTPVTDLLVANLAGSPVPSTWYSGIVAAPATLSSYNQARVDTSLGNVRAALGTVLGNGPHPITAAFTAAPGNPTDDILSALAKALVSNGVNYSTLLALSGASAGASFNSPSGFNTASTTPVEPAARSGTFAATGALSSARNSHAAILLPSGKVLVVGGLGSTSLAVATAELYDPATGTWAPAASMSTARSSPTGTLLPDGKVLLSGGQTGLVLPTSIASAELYDPATNTWTAAGTLSTGRSLHTATLLPNGKVLVAGGLNTAASASNLAVAELYDPATNAWRPAATMANARYSHTATLFSNGKVLVAGGLANTGDTSTAELYDSAANTWAPAASMATARYLHTAVLLGNGKLLVAGGSGFVNGAFTTFKTAETYDPATNTWAAAGAMNIARSSHTATPLPEGKILVAGGFSMVATAELFDTATNTWSLTSPMTAGRHAHAATLLGNGKVLISGGVGPQPSSAELF